ncbi:MAG: hypothetical protein AVDCRST_MAG67-4364, partial [uncultured Solirubrobacteraceae bacterium]
VEAGRHRLAPRQVPREPRRRRSAPAARLGGVRNRDRPERPARPARRAARSSLLGDGEPDPSAAQARLSPPAPARCPTARRRADDLVVSLGSHCERSVVRLRCVNGGADPVRPVVRRDHCVALVADPLSQALPERRRGRRRDRARGHGGSVEAAPAADGSAPAERRGARSRERLRRSGRSAQGV